MPKWIELTLNAFFNISVGVSAAGMINLIIANGQIFGSLIAIFSGLASIFVFSIIAKKLEK